jgi:hypothetical protein
MAGHVMYFSLVPGLQYKSTGEKLENSGSQLLVSVAKITSCGDITATLGTDTICAVWSPEFSSSGALVSSRVICRYVAVYQNKPTAAIQCVFPQLASLLN